MYEVAINYLLSCSWQVSYCFLPYADTNFVQNKSSTKNCSGYDKSFPSQGWKRCSATLNLNKVGEISQTHPIPKTPSLGSLHSSNKYRLKQSFDKQNNRNTTNILKSYSCTHLNGLLSPHGFSWIPCVLLDQETLRAKQPRQDWSWKKAVYVHTLP